MEWENWSERSAYLMIQADRPAAEKVWKEAQKWDRSIGAWMLTGSWDMMLWLDATHTEDLYEKVVWVRNQKGVKATSSHFVYKGAKNAKWWWNWPVGSWVFVRSQHLNGEIKDFKKWDWTASVASIPGDWDYLAWVGGKKWEDVWSHVWSLNQAGWHTQTVVPMKSWWNKTWKNRWWS